MPEELGEEIRRKILDKIPHNAGRMSNVVDEAFIDRCIGEFALGRYRELVHWHVAELEDRCKTS